jgi:hypothetical protein
MAAAVGGERALIIVVVHNRQVGDGAQRLLRRSRHASAGAEVERGESAEAAQCLKALVRHLAGALEVERGECGEAAHCPSQQNSRRDMRT